ncbi:MAG: CoA transferase [Actinobacteria bacterium]|nr:MAG: CoA transferase [Actinomycetota bacterium]
MAGSLLDGVTVLDLASVGPAARASRWLADYGATVVKVGPVPAGDGVHITPPFFAYSAHRAMKRVMVDLKSAGGTDVFMRLAEHADVVIESFRPGVAARLGIGYDDVRARNPRIVYCSTTGYGQSGPHAGRAGHDLDYLAVSGFLDCSGRGPDGKPPIPGATVADSAGGGMQAVIAILAALVGRGATGEGAYLDVSVADGVVALMALQIDEYLATGVVPGAGHGLLTGRYACYDTYRAADGGWLAVAAIEERFWSNLCRALGLPQWVDRQTDDAVQERIRSDLAAVFATRDRDEWVAELAEADTCVAPVLSVPEVVEDPQLSARGAFVKATHPQHGTFLQVAPVLAGSERPEGSYRVRDAGETDTDELLAGVGMSPDDCARLRASGVVA